MDLSENNFETLPSNIGLLSRLTTLDLTENNIGALPEGFFSNLTSLETFNISYNSLTVIGDNMPNCPALTTMQLSYNKLAQLPATLGTLNALEYLYVRQNKLSGAALSTLGDLPRLKVLDLSANLLTSIPNEWASLPSIEQIIMQQNQLNTAFPLFLKVLNSLSVLDLSNNNLNHALPDMNVGDFAGLVLLNLAYNDFTATISDLSASDTLQHLSLNALTGKIHRRLATWPRYTASHWYVRAIDPNCVLHANDLVRVLTLLSHSSLVQSSNKLTGFIPIELINLPVLSTLDLSSNTFQGSFQDGSAT